MKSKKDPRALLNIKNLVRGAISIIRVTSTPEVRRQKWKQEQLAYQQINKAITKARTDLDCRQLIGFESWLADYTSKHLNIAAQIGVNRTALGLFPTQVNSRDLVAELNSARERLKRHATNLLTFAKDAKDLAYLICGSDWNQGLAIIKKILDRDGYSYWAIENEIALTQRISGLEETKKKIIDISIETTGLHKFILYYFGVRNEPSQTTSRFKANLRRRIDDINMSDNLRHYYKYRLYGQLDVTQSNLAHVLAFEQLTSAIDLLFSTIKVCRLIIGNHSAFSEKVTKIAIETLADLRPILLQLGFEESPVNDSLDKCLNQPESLMPSTRLQKYAYESIQVALNACNQEIEGDQNFKALLTTGLASSLSSRSDGILAENLQKLLFNFNWLPEAIEFADVSSIQPLPELFVNAILYPTKQNANNYTITDATAFVVASLIEKTLPASGELQELIETLLSIRHCPSHSSLDDVEKISNAPFNSVTKDIVLVFLAHCYFENGDIDRCITICAESAIENDRLMLFLPLEKLFQGVKWPAIKEWSTTVELPIALDHYLRVIEDKKAKTYKRYSIEELMRHYQCRSVTELPDALNACGIQIKKIEFLCYYACDVATLELLPGIDGSRAVLGARKGLLMGLSGLNTERAMQYLNEANEIEADLHIDDGLTVLNDSNVYVDEQAVLNFVSKELSADFHRYLTLVESGLGTSESIADLVHNFNNPSAKTFQIPKNDADDLLAEILSALLYQFLFDPASGLDIIIGRRIRHGTISSEIRGQLEKFNLIGFKSRPGASYEPSSSVAKFSASFDPKHRKVIHAAFSRFSESIDQFIALYCDEYFNVRSKEKPRGLFELSMTAPLFALSRTIAQSCESIEQFSKECFELFWYQLSVKLDAIRPSYEADAKKTMNSIFARLFNELSAANITDAAFLAHLQHAAEDLQRRASAIAGWIRVPSVNANNNVYTMQQVVDVAMAVVKGQRNGFMPIISSRLPENIYLDNHGLSIVSDALYIAFFNICQHSGKKADNKVDIEIYFDEPNSLLSFVITNEVAKGTRTEAKDQKLSEILANIHKHAYSKRARGNKGSGLYKLGALVMQSEKASISFGFLSSGSFQLKFDLLYISFSNSEKLAKPIANIASPTVCS